MQEWWLHQHTGPLDQVKSKCCSRNRTGVLKTVFYVCVCVYIVWVVVYGVFIYVLSMFYMFYCKTQWDCLFMTYAIQNIWLDWLWLYYYMLLSPSVLPNSDKSQQHGHTTTLQLTSFILLYVLFIKWICSVWRCFSVWITDSHLQAITPPLSSLSWSIIGKWVWNVFVDLLRVLLNIPHNKYRLVLYSDGWSLVE